MNFNVSKSVVLSDMDKRSLVHAHADLGAVAGKGPVIIDRGDKVHVRDTTGKTYLDGLSGMWCVGLGYGDKDIADAISEQVTNLTYAPIFGEKTNETAVLLSDKVTTMGAPGMTRAFFVNSGSEANDTALKLVWYVNNIRGYPRKKKIITFDRAYHGSTVGSASLTALPHMHASFDLPICGVVRVPAPDHRRFGNGSLSCDEIATEMVAEISKIIEANDPATIGAFFAEPVLGAGGLIIPPRKFYPKLQAVLRKHDILLVADEIITGFGRTGEMFGSQTFNMKPDMMTLAKNLSSGYVPIGAVLMKESIYDSMVIGSGANGTFSCGMTYSGHPVAAAAALACLNKYAQPGFLENIRRLGQELHKCVTSLRCHGAVIDIRTTGLLGGVELAASPDGSMDGASYAKWIVDRALDRGLIIRALGNTIVFCPPFVSSTEHINKMVDIIDNLLEGQ